MDMILCVGSKNIDRSAMFEALLQNAAEEAGRGKSLKVNSAGISPVTRNGKPASKRAQECMGAIGLNLQSHCSRWIGDVDLSQYGTILCMDRSILEVIQTSAVSSTKAKIVLINAPDGFEDL